MITFDQLFQSPGQASSHRDPVNALVVGVLYLGGAIPVAWQILQADLVHRLRASVSTRNRNTHLMNDQSTNCGRIHTPKHRSQKAAR